MKKTLLASGLVFLLCVGGFSSSVNGQTVVREMVSLNTLVSITWSIWGWRYFATLDSATAITPPGITAQFVSCPIGLPIPSCNFIFRSDGTIRPGVYNATVSISGYADDPNGVPVDPLGITVIYPFQVGNGVPNPTPTPTPTPLPETGLLSGNSNNSCSIKAHSSVNTDTLALQETIPLVGVPFELNYSSDRFRNNINFSMKTLGLGGWSPSIVHHYDVSNQTLYTGDGGIRPVAAVSMPSGYYLASQSGSEIYYFSSAGLHTETKDALTGLTKYYISYDSTLRLSSVVDRFSNATTINYFNGTATITSPYGQVTNLTFNSFGFLNLITNPNNETYNLSADESGFLLSFQKPSGQKSLVSYDTHGYVLKDIGAGGDFVSFMRQFDHTSGIQTVISSTALGRQTMIKTSTPDVLSSTHIINSPSGMQTTRINQDQGGLTSQDSLGNASSTVLAMDPRFGWMAPYERSTTYQVANSNINISAQTNHTAQLGNANDPLSVISLNTTTVLQNDPTKVFSLSYDASKKLITTLSPLKRVTYKTLDTAGLLSNFQMGGLISTSFSYDSRGRLTSVVQGTRNMSFAFDNHGNIIEITDFLGRKTSFEFDEVNRVTKKTLPDGNVISMSYDANGNVTSITPPSRPSHSFSYNLFEKVASYLPPALSTLGQSATTYQYNLDQQITRISRPDGAELSMDYDSVSGLLNSLSTSQGNYNFGYLAKSDLLSTVTSPDGVTLSYQYAGNISTFINTTGPVLSSLGISYNNDGTVGALSVAGKYGTASLVALNYDKDGLLVGAGSEVLSLDSVGAVSSTKLGKISELVAYDSFGQKLSFKFTNGGASFFLVDI